MTQTGTVVIAVLVDALGWDVLKRSALWGDRWPSCKRIRTVLGYSSAAVPSILTGRLPRDHGRWSYLYYDPLHSPFRWTRAFRFAGPLVDNRLVDNPLAKRLIARWTARREGWDGYFPVYDFPLRYLHLMDHCSRRWDFRPGAFACPSLVDVLHEAGVPSLWLTYPMQEEEIFSRCEGALRDKEAQFYFLYLAAVDALGHAHGPAAAAVMDRLAWYDQRLRRLEECAISRYKNVRLFVFSDHGMVETGGFSRLKHHVEMSRLRFGSDYVAVYDSTMARFWYLAAGAKEVIEGYLEADGNGRILTDGEKSCYGVDFPDNRFGEAIYLLRTGVVFHPSHMSRRPLRAMHGYDPYDPLSDGVFLSNGPLRDEPGSITDIMLLLLGALGIVDAG